MLTGGVSSCETRGQPDYFGRLSRVRQHSYPQVIQEFAWRPRMIKLQLSHEICSTSLPQQMCALLLLRTSVLGCYTDVEESVQCILVLDNPMSGPQLQEAS